MKELPRIGLTVRLRRGVSMTPGPRKVARVAHHLSDVEGGVILDAYLDGFRYWNKDDLEPVKTCTRSQR